MSGSGASPRVGFVGLGQMGWPMATRLRAAGFELTVLDQDPDVCRRFSAEHGAAVATSGPALGEASDVVITMLPNGAVVRSVLLGEGAGSGGVVSGMGAGTTVLDMSSSDPVGTRQLSDEVRGHGVDLLDAPVSGGVPRARTGDLAILVGGTPEQFQRCRPILEPLGSAIFHTGAVGSGHALKALNNLLSAASLAVTAEVMLVGARFGLDPSVMVDVFNASSGRNNSTEKKFRPYVLSGSYDAGFALDLMVKDIRTAQQLARRTDTPVPVSDDVVRRWEAAQAALPPGSDHTALVKYLQDEIGTSLELG